MKATRMLGIAVVMALTGMALQASSAVATDPTALCQVMPGNGPHEVCPTEYLVSHVHEVTLTNTKAKLLTSIVTVECTVLFLGDVLSAKLLATPLVVSGSFTYSSCSNGCSVSEVNGPANILVLKEGHELGSVIGHGKVLVNCSLFGVHCIYTGGGVKGHALGFLLGTHVNGEVRIEGATIEQDPTESLSFCPASTKLDLLTVGLAPTFITE